MPPFAMDTGSELDTPMSIRKGEQQLLDNPPQPHPHNDANHPGIRLLPNQFSRSKADHDGDDDMSGQGGSSTSTPIVPPPASSVATDVQHPTLARNPSSSSRKPMMSLGIASLPSPFGDHPTFSSPPQDQHPSMPNPYGASPNASSSSHPALTPSYQQPPPSLQYRSVRDVPDSPGPSSSPHRNYSQGMFASSSSPVPGLNTPGPSTPFNAWHHLAVTSGAPTPSLEGPSPFHSAFGEAVTPLTNRTFARGNSPQIGGPFEKLNLEGAWSGANFMASSPNASGSGGGGGGEGSSGRRSSSGDQGMTSMSPPTARPRRPSGGNLAGPMQGLSRPSGSGTGNPPMKLNLPAALASRRGSIPLVSSQLAGPSTINTVPIPASNKSTTTSARSGPNPPPSPLNPLELAPLLASSSTTLLLDLRPPSSFSESHIPLSYSIPIPSTLLKRPTFTIQKLAAMLNQRTMDAVLAYKDKRDVVLIDQDSSSVAPGSVIAGLATKLMAGVGAEWKGKVWFLKGGINGCARTDGVDLVEGSSEEGEETGQETGSPAGGSQTLSGSESPAASFSSATAVPSGRMVGGLGKLAFQQASVKGPSQRRLNAPKGLTMPPTPSVDAAGFPFASLAGPGGDEPLKTGAITERAGSSGMLTSRGDAGSLDGTATQVTAAKRLQPANPFFDNIRQNLELSHGGITERIPLALPERVAKRAGELPKFLRDLVEQPEEETARLLAGQFEAVERGEQRRLQGVMEWHSRSSGAEGPRMSWIKDGDEDEDMEDANETPAETVTRRGKKKLPAELRRMGSRGALGRDPREMAGMVEGEKDKQDVEDVEDYFPFSITAGVERGSKNRYKNIWPYDFSRVRLKQRCHDDGSDYINASFVQPKGTTKRYIATQGPLDATFRDFWTLVWEQDVHVIVMLTKQFEAGQLKCGSYWTDGTYGPFQLDHILTEGGDDKVETDVSGFNFHVGPPKVEENATTIKRTFRLSNRDLPEVPPRSIIQLQSVTWPDFDVPSDPEVLLSLLKEVDEAVEVAAESDPNERAGAPPILVHCSAGVGRTGSYIAVDAILDGLRREYVHANRKIKGSLHVRDFAAASRTRTTSIPHSGSLGKSPLQSPPSFAGFRIGESLDSKSKESSGSSADLAPRPAPVTMLSGSRPPAESPDLMDVDGSSTAGSGTYGSYREESNDSSVASSQAGMSQRPSLVNSSLRYSDESQNLFSEMGDIPEITNSYIQARPPSPLSAMEEPVRDVLEGMRVQRMSLCQSLRQYAFVYRSIITGYLNMVDDERESSMHDDHTRQLSGPSSAGNTTDEETHTEGHPKRRASPTELRGASLTKRPSIKTIRHPKHETSGPSTLNPSASTASLHSSGSTGSLVNNLAALGKMDETK